MKKAWWICVIICCFLLTCSGKEYARENVNKIADELDNTEIYTEESEDTSSFFISKEFACSENVYTSFYLQHLTSDVLRFKDRIYVNGDCYEYQNGYYHNLPHQSITEFTPEGAVNPYVTQSNDYLIYQWDVKVDSEWIERVAFVNPYTGELVESFDIDGSFAATYEDEIYYRIIDDEVDDVVRINCKDLSQEAIFSVNGFIRNVIPKEDGTIVFSVLDNGWWEMNPQGEVKYLLESIEQVCDEYVTWYGASGYYSMIEYYNHVCEMIHIKENGEYERLYNMLSGLRNLVFMEDYFINIDNRGTLYFYNYSYRPLEEEINPNIPMTDYQAFATIKPVEDEILEAGYSLDVYHICDDAVWLFLKDDEKNLVVRCWQFQTLEELNNSMMNWIENCNGGISCDFIGNATVFLLTKDR